MKDQKDFEFFLLINGQKNGPYTREEIAQKVRKKEILFTFQVSINNGRSWDNLFNIEGFDRRNFERDDELPHLPKQEIFDEEAKNATRILMNSDHSSLDATVALAHIGNISGSGRNSGNSTKKINLKKLRNEKSNTDSNSQASNESNDFDPIELPRSNKFENLKWLALMVISLIGLKVLYFPDFASKEIVDGKKKKTLQNRVSKNKQVKKALLPKPTNIARKNFNKSKRLRKPRSIKKAIRPRAPKKLSNNPRKIRFESNRSPAQTHPQRRKLSRETLNPKDDYDNYDDYEDEDLSKEELRKKRLIASKNKKRKSRAKSGAHNEDNYDNDNAEQDEERELEDAEEGEEREMDQQNVEAEEEY